MANTKQHLKHGKALCGAVFAGFVETFNALVDFMWNVKGDADLNNGEGHIKIDRSNPLHPVIRFINNEKDDSTSDPDDPDDPEKPEDPEDPDEPATSCVTSLNSKTGRLVIAGGAGIEVTVKGNTIKISCKKDKGEDEDPVAQDPCGHPGSEGPHGGADPETDRTHGENDEGDFENDGDWPHHGGVSASDDGHEGDPCNCN